MVWVVAAIIVVALGVAAVAATGGFGEMSREPVRDVFRADLPDRPLTSTDLDGLRFGVNLRGYSMVQVDDVLARLGRELAARDQTISDLRDDSFDTPRDSSYDDHDHEHDPRRPVAARASLPTAEAEELA